MHMADFTFAAFDQEKQRVYNKAKKYNKSEAWCEHKSLKNQAKHLLHCHHNEYLSNIMPSNTSNKKPFWHHVKSKRQDISGISTLNSSTGTIVSKPSKTHKLNFVANTSNLYLELKI